MPPRCDRGSGEAACITTSAGAAPTTPAERPVRGGGMLNQVTEVIERTYARFAHVIESIVPFGHRFDLRFIRRVYVTRERGICGEHGRVLKTIQNLCPRCGGFVIDAEEAEQL